MVGCVWIVEVSCAEGRVENFELNGMLRNVELARVDGSGFWRWRVVAGRR